MDADKFVPKQTRKRYIQRFSGLGGTQVGAQHCCALTIICTSRLLQSAVCASCAHS